MSYKAKPLYEAFRRTGKTQVTVAREIGVDRGVFGRILREQQLPTHDQAVWIAKALDTEIEEIFPDGKFRGDQETEEKDARLAERILSLEASAADILAEKGALEAQQQEMIDQFSAKLSELHNELVEQRSIIAKKDEEIEALKFENAMLSMKSWLAKKSDRAAQQRITTLQTQVQHANGLAVAGGGAAVLTGLALLLSKN